MSNLYVVKFFWIKYSVVRNTSVLVISTHIQMIFCVFFLFYYLLFLNVQIKIMGKERKSVNPHLIDEMILPCKKMSE